MKTNPPRSHRQKTKMPPSAVATRPADVRIRDFDPITAPFDPAGAMAEADRCLGCPKQPCVTACPLDNNIPLAMRCISDGDFLEAADVYRETSTLPGICGRICPQERLCEGACVLAKHGQAIALGALEAFTADYARAHAEPRRTTQRAATSGKRIAVIGSGPAGLSAAQRLLERGHAVTLYEAWPAPGGWLTYTIPTYKLPRSIVSAKIAEMEDAGAQFVLNTRVGSDIALDDLRAQYDAVFIGVGAMHDVPVRFPGDNVPGIYTGTAFLLPTYTPEPIRPAGFPAPDVGQRVVVFGGGDTAIDCVRTALRLQVARGLLPNVTLCYRRSEQDMPATLRERLEAADEGVQFVYQVTPMAFRAGPEARVAEVIVQRTIPGAIDDSGRPHPDPVAGSEHPINADTVILALGYTADPLLSGHAPELATHRAGLVIADNTTGHTSLGGVFAGGDSVRGPNLASVAARDGINAAEAIEDYLVSQS